MKNIARFVVPVLTLVLGIAIGIGISRGERPQDNRLEQVKRDLLSYSYHEQHKLWMRCEEIFSTWSETQRAIASDLLNESAPQLQLAGLCASD